MTIVFEMVSKSILHIIKKSSVKKQLNKFGHALVPQKENV